MIEKVSKGQGLALGRLVGTSTVQLLDDHKRQKNGGMSEVGVNKFARYAGALPTNISCRSRHSLLCTLILSSILQSGSYTIMRLDVDCRLCRDSRTVSRQLSHGIHYSEVSVQHL